MGWRLWDHALTEEIAKEAHVDRSAVMSATSAWTAPFTGWPRTFWRGSYERSMPLKGTEPFDADRFVAIGQECDPRGRRRKLRSSDGAAPYFLRAQPDVFPSSLCPRAGKNCGACVSSDTAKRSRRTVDTVDRRSHRIREHYFGADWPTRCSTK